MNIHARDVENVNRVRKRMYCITNICKSRSFHNRQLCRVCRAVWREYLNTRLDVHVKDKQLVLSHETDTDTLDRSTIRLAFQENIEFPGFRRSNQFVAIRGCSSLEFTLDNILLEQSVGCSLAERPSSVFAQQSIFYPDQSLRCWAM